MSRLFIFSFLMYCSTSCKQVSQNQLPIYDPTDFNPKLVDRSLHDKVENHKVDDFQLTNQNGIVVTQEDYKNKIYVVDFFFTRCPSICPIMTDNLVKVQNHFIDNNNIMLLSLSVTPNIDSVSVLKKYAQQKGVVDHKWNITTGDKKHIYHLARKSYFAVVEQGDGGLQDFIHTPNFILVDTKKQIRGVYDGTDNEDVVRLINDIEILVDNKF
ncbi:MAG: SCO family protein [Flavobacteriales bacterium]|jgi:protein SCO1/2